MFDRSWKRQAGTQLTGSDDEEGEEEEQGEEEKPTVDEETGEVSAPKRKKRKGDSMELVEYSADELRSVDKDLLNAEITQLEGELTNTGSSTLEQADTLQKRPVAQSPICRYLPNTVNAKPNISSVHPIWRLSLPPGMPPSSDMMSCGMCG